MDKQTMYALIKAFRELEGNKKNERKRIKNPSIMELDVGIKTHIITNLAT